MKGKTEKPKKVSYSSMLFSTLTLGIITNLFLYIGQLYIIRTLTRDAYASFVVATSFVALLSLIADLGLTPFFTKAFAESDEKMKEGNNEASGEMLGSYLLLRFFLSVIVTVLTISLSYLLGYGKDEITLMCLFLPSLIISSRLLVFRSTGESVLRSQHRFHLISLYACIDAAIFGTAMYIAHNQRSDVYWVMSIYTFSNIPGFILLFISITNWTKKERMQLKINLSLIRSTLLSAMPLAIGTAFLAIHNNVDSLLLDKLSTPSEVSAYGAGIRLLSAFIFIPSIIGGVIAPLVTKAIYNQTPELVLKKVHQLQAFMLAGTSILAIIITLIPDMIIAMLFGADKYSDIRNIVVLFGWTFIPISYVTFCTEISIAEGKIWLPTIYLSIVLFASLISDILLIPIYGAFGAALAKCISVSIGSIVFYVLIGQLQTIQRNNVSKLFLMMVLSVVIILIAAWFIVPVLGRGIAVIVLIPLLVTILLLFKVLHFDEIKEIVVNLFIKAQA